MATSVYPDYRTQSQRERDRRRENAEQRARDAERQAAIRAELDRQAEVLTLFPATAALAHTAVVAFAYRLEDHDALELTWIRIWQRSYELFEAAKESGDRCALSEARDELHQIAQIGARLAATREIREGFTKAIG